MDGRFGAGAPGAEDEGAEDEGAEAVRLALHAAALEVDPAPWPRSAVAERARGMRRRRRLAVAAPLVAAAVVTAGLLVPGARSTGVRVLPAASGPPHPRMSSSPIPGPPVRVVGPGRRIDLGHGWWMTLETGRRCLGQGTVPQCKSTVDGNQGAGTVGLQTAGDASGTLYTPLYVGHGNPARMTVRAGGKLYDAQVVTLAGDPGYATGYLWGPPTSLAAADRVRITVYDARGAVLAAFP